MPLPDPGTLALFAGAAILLLVIPGPAVLYIVAQSIEHGRRAGLVSMLGVQAGALVHVAAAARPSSRSARARGASAPRGRSGRPRPRT